MPFAHVKAPNVPVEALGVNEAGVAVRTGLPYSSRRVTVTVVVWPTDRIVSATASVLWAAVGAPATTVVVAVSRDATVGLEAMSRYPTPAFWMLIKAKVATPFVGRARKVPRSVAPGAPEVGSSPMTMLSLAVVITRPRESFSATCTLPRVAPAVTLDVGRVV